MFAFSSLHFASFAKLKVIWLIALLANIENLMNSKTHFFISDYRRRFELLLKGAVREKSAL